MPAPPAPPPNPTYPPYAQPQPPTGPPYPLPQPISSGSVDLSSIKPVSSGSVSIADAIAKARGFAAEKGVSYEPSRGTKNLVRFLSRLTRPIQPLVNRIPEYPVGAIAALVRPREPLLVLFEIIFETIIIHIATNAEEVMTEDMQERGLFPRVPTIDFRLPSVRDMCQETAPHPGVQEGAMATQTLCQSKGTLSD